MVSEVSRGFREDCYDLLAAFARHESIEFRHFCQEWKRMNFQFIFYGRNTDVEMIAFVTEALVIVKKIFLNTRKPLDKIGAFFLMYAMYFKQPNEKFCKIRVTMKDWTEFKRFAQWPTMEYHSAEISAIFWKMFIGDAFRFVQSEFEYGYDSFFVKGDQSGRFDDKSRESFKLVRQAEKEFLAMKSNTGLYTALDALEMGYNEMKESLEETEPSGSSSDKIPQSNLMQGLHRDLDVLIAILNTSNEPRPEDDLADNPDGESIGTKRSTLKDKAFARKVQRRDMQIATSTQDAGGGSSGSLRRPRATKKRDPNSSLMSNDARLEVMSSDDDELAV
ncbi:snRNA-activating protein complex subunit 1 isoform X1 [Armigeres subalbatus]|uniref:snRNA-activating protein complex subunit 1 isoform X1 n=1 Tax=Armigeres subalbatus TaxID=124917 RepID=UPI002ED157E2